MHRNAFVTGKMSKNEHAHTEVENLERKAGFQLRINELSIWIDSSHDVFTSNYPVLFNINMIYAWRVEDLTKVGENNLCFKCRVGTA